MSTSSRQPPPRIVTAASSSNRRSTRSGQRSTFSSCGSKKTATGSRQKVCNRLILTPSQIVQDRIGTQVETARTKSPVKRWAIGLLLKKNQTGHYAPDLTATARQTQKIKVHQGALELAQALGVLQAVGGVPPHGLIVGV
ncbi:ORFL190C [Human betaherpesvirus 5]|nr:ORFL190C [Human betaherpesvirus 5]QHX40534.1 ORFL190C [Human betaherpesvirus 5]